MDLRSKVAHTVQSMLEKSSGSILTVNTAALSEPSKEKEIRSNVFEGRIPSKKFELTVLDLTNVDSIDEKKLDKYLLKSTKYSLIFGSDEAVKNLAEHDFFKSPVVYIDHTKSMAFSIFKSYLDLSASRKDFLKQTHDIETYINNNFRKLGFVNTSDSPSSIVICFNSDQLKDEFINSLNKKFDPNTVTYFNTYVLKKYASGIDNRNARFKQNLLFIGSIAGKSIKTVSKSIKRTGNKISNGLNKTKADISKKRLQRKTKPIQVRQNDIPQKVSVKKNNFIGDFTKKISSKVENTTDLIKEDRDTIEASLLLRDFPIYSKQMTFDEYIRSTNKKDSGFTKQRTLQKIKNSIKFSLVMVVSDIDEIWLNKSVRAIKDQSYTNWEFIIIDNCSPRTYLKSYLSSLNDPRIKTVFFNSKKTYSECLSTAVYKSSTGDFIGIIDEGDELNTDTLFLIAKSIFNSPDTDIIYTDEDMINEQGKRIHPFFKPGWDKTLITSYPYLNHIFFVKKEILERVDSLKSNSIKDPIWDMLLRLMNSTQNILHIEEILYHKRIRPLHKPPLYESTPDALKSFLDREVLQSNILPAKYPGAYIQRKNNISQEKVSVIVFDKNLESIENFVKSFKPLHQNIELIIGTEKPPKEINAPYPIIFYRVNDFCFSKDANIIVQNIATGDHILFLDSRMRYLNPNFIDLMVSYSLNNNIVGTLITDPDNIIEQGIYCMGIGKPIGTLNEGQIEQSTFYTSVTMQCTAVSKKCMMAKKEIFLSNPFDETLRKSYQDIDFCLRSSKSGYTSVYLPDAGQKSIYAYSKETFFKKDTIRYVKKWKKEIYSPDKFIPKLYLSVK